MGGMAHRQTPEELVHMGTGEPRGTHDVVAAVRTAASARLGASIMLTRASDIVHSAPTAVPVWASSDHLLGWLVCERPLAGEQRRFLESLATVITAHVAESDECTLRLDEHASRIRKVLDDGAISVVYQPIVDLGAGVRVGYEALARFPIEPLRSPDSWFAEAEAAGLGVELELAAARVAVAGFARLPAGSFLAINASPRVAVHRCFREYLRGLPPELLVIEMTEHARIEDYEQVNRRLNRRRAEGVRVAVDDAGAGFASMNHILGLVPNIIKLDAGLVRGVDQNPRRRSLVRSMARFGSEVGADILAEGVETHSELATLVELGVRYGQGFLLGRPAALAAA
jgi:EAL domain-containing protein (putative c-di-GMP-specific phosphodiesterase class I)